MIGHEHDRAPAAHQSQRGAQRGLGVMGRAVGMPLVERGHHRGAVRSREKRLPRGQALDERPLGARRRRGQRGGFFRDRPAGIVGKRRHGSAAVEDEDDPLRRVRPQPARTGQKPCEESDRKELEPERGGIPQPLEPPPLRALGRKLLEQEQRACPDPPGFALQKMDEQHRRDAEQRPESGGVGKEKAFHHAAISTAPRGSACR